MEQIPFKRLRRVEDRNRYKAQQALYDARQEGDEESERKALDELNRLDQPITDYYTAQQMALLIGETVSSMQYWRDILPGARAIGKRLVFEKTPELEEWLRATKANPESHMEFDMAGRRLELAWHRIGESVRRSLETLGNLPAADRKRVAKSLSSFLSHMQKCLKRAEDALQTGTIQKEDIEKIFNPLPEK
jgi:hypothetical protein